LWPGAVISGDEICSNPMSAYWPTPERQLLILRIAGVGQKRSFRCLSLRMFEELSFG
jgi:hypothetical protein